MPLKRFVALQWFLIAAAIVWLIYLLAPILTPFVAAAIIAYVCDPWVDKLCELKLPRNWQLPRTLATLLVMSALFGLLALLILIMVPLLQKEFRHLMDSLPALLELARVKLLPFFSQYFNIHLQFDMEMFKNLFSTHWQTAGGAAVKVLPWLGGSGAILLGIVVNVMLIPLALFYLLRDWPLWLSKIGGAIPRRKQAKVYEIAGEIDTVLAQFLRGQISVMIIMSTFYVLGLWLAGLEFALPIGIVTGMLVFVPYLGMFIGLALATLAAFTQFDQFSSIVIIWAVFGAGQLIEGMLITPWLVGERIGLHPLVVIFALLAFGQLFGFFGLLLALPISAAMLVGLRHVNTWYLNSHLYND